MHHSITFGDKNTWDDWHLIPDTVPIINPPPPKIKKLDIPGGDGSIDLSEAVTGYPVYTDRTGSLRFTASREYGPWKRRFAEIKEYLHGRAMRMTLEDDPGWFWEGRFTVRDIGFTGFFGVIVIDYDLGPFKWYITATDEPWLWDPFNFHTGVVGSATYWDESTDPPMLVYTGYGDAYGHIPVTNTDEPLEFAQSGSAPVQPVFSVSGSRNAVVTVGSTGHSVPVGTPESVAGLVLWRGIWLYNGQKTTVKVKAGTLSPSTAETKTVTGTVAAFDDGIAGAALQVLSTSFEASQAGTGTPTPDNVRAITGLTGITINHSGEDTSDPDEIAVSWETGAGTIGAGTLNVVTGVLTITHKYISFDGTETWEKTGSGDKAYYRYRLDSAGTQKVVNDSGICSHFAAGVISSSTTTQGFRVWYSASTPNYVLIRPNIDSITAPNTMKAWVKDQYDNGTPLRLVYKLYEPETVNLTAQTVNAKEGENNIWSSAGEAVTVTYVKEGPTTLAVQFREGRL